MIETDRLVRFLALLAVGTLAFQLELGGIVRFAPTDLFVVLALLLGAASIAYRPGSIIVAAVVFPVVMAAMLAPAIAKGHVPTAHTLVVKVGGAALLTGSYLLWQHVFREGPMVRRALKWFMVGGMGFSAAALVRWFGLSFPLADLLFVERARYVGSLVDPNNFGAFMASALVIAVVAYPYPFRSRGAATLNVVLATVFVAASTSRGAWIALAISLPVAMYVSGRLRTKHVVVVGAASALALAAGLVANAVAEFEGRPDNVADRLNQFDIGVGAALQTPLTGIGLGEFQLLHDGIIHNSLVWLWVEGGLLGVVLFAALALAPIRHVLRARATATVQEHRLLHALLGAHVCMLIVSMGIEATYQRYWWFYLALLTSVVAQIQTRAPDAIRRVSVGAAHARDTAGR